MNQYKPVNQRIASRRMQLGVSAVEVARSARMSIYEYSDLEQDDTEPYMVVPIYNLKKVCRRLDLDFLELFEIPCAFCQLGQEFLESYWLNRNALILAKRQSLKLTHEQLGNRLGFYPIEIQNLETYPAHLESWVMENIPELAREIDIPLQVLLDTQCRSCGR